jgi:hypothetical protein
MDSGGCVHKHSASRLLGQPFALLVVISIATASLGQEQFNSNRNPAASSTPACGPGVFSQGLSPTYEQPQQYQNGSWQCPPPQPGDTWLGVNGKNCTYEKPVPCQPIPMASPGAGASTGNGNAGGSSGNGNGAGNTQSSVEPQIVPPPLKEGAAPEVVTQPPSDRDAYSTNGGNPPAPSIPR